MVITINNADFSTNNIGKIEIVSLSQFTINAITASGNSTMTNEQKSALEEFFSSVGAINNTGIWAKIKTIYLPMLATDLSKAFVNYNGNVVDITPDATKYAMRSGGVTSAVADNTGIYAQKKSMLLDGKNLSYFVIFGEDVMNGNTNLFSYQGNSGSCRFLATTGASTGGGAVIQTYYVNPSTASQGMSMAAVNANLKNLLFGVSVDPVDKTKVYSILNTGAFYEKTISGITSIGTDTAAVNAPILGDASGKINKSTANPVRMMIIGESMTQEEVLALKTASEPLANMFPTT